MHGVGKLTSPSGEIYDGGIVGNSKCGFGVLTTTRREVYKGMFNNNKKHGEGEFSYENGDFYQGMAQNLKIFDSPCSPSNESTYVLNLYCNPLFTRIIGSFQKDLKCGHGVYTYANGDTYKGSYKSNRKSGNGIYTHHLSGESYRCVHETDDSYK